MPATDPPTKPSSASHDGALDDDFLLRYQRQILLPEFGLEGQQRLAHARVLVLGLGGLGSPVALYLAAAGVGTLLLADHDRIDASNLQRQILHTEDHIGALKTDSAVARLQALNPATRLIPIPERLDEPALLEHAKAVDLIIDASDNFATRFAANRASVAAGVPLVSGAAIRAEGQISCFSGGLGGPCYQCLYPDDASAPPVDTNPGSSPSTQSGANRQAHHGIGTRPRTDAESTDAGATEGCAANGVLAPVVGIVGSVQACEAIKILSGFGTPLFGRLLLLDARVMHWRELRLGADPSCPVCANLTQPAGDTRA